MSNLHLQAQVRRGREATGLTREDFARAVGTSTSTIARIELGGHVPSTAVVQAIAAYLGTTMDELLRTSAA